MESLKGGCTALCACLCGCVAAAVPITFVVYLGIYAFNNPDNEAWVGVAPTGKQALYADETAGTLAKATSLADIHGRFVSWFLWGFLQNLVLPVSAVLLIGLGMLINEGLGKCCGGLASLGMCCGGTAWWITGIVWRFRSEGAYAAGDFVPEGKSVEDWDTEISGEDSLFQYKSGKFMFIYFMICWSFMALGCLCSAIGAIAACVAGK